MGGHNRTILASARAGRGIARIGGISLKPLLLFNNTPGTGKLLCSSHNLAGNP